jgi:predicted protein tyrosine phosphatase
LLGPGREADVLREVYRLQPQALPNGRMLQHADTALRRDGALVPAAALQAEAGRRTKSSPSGVAR